MLAEALSPGREGQRGSIFCSIFQRSVLVSLTSLICPKSVLNFSPVECFYYVGNLAVVLPVMYYPIAQRLLVVVMFMRYENIESITRWRYQSRL